MVHHRGSVHGVASEHERERQAREVPLGLVAMPVGLRLLAGALFAAGWALAVFRPLVRVIESDVPSGMLAVALSVATVSPVLLYLRRHALHASLRWDERTVTLLRGGRVATSIAWREAIVRRSPSATQIADAAGRTITLTTGVGVSPTPLGRVRIERPALEALLRTAAQSATFAHETPRVDGPPAWLAPTVAACLLVALALDDAPLFAPQVAAGAFAMACAALLVDPVRRLASALRKPAGREVLVIDTEERGRLRVRRLDGSRVLLDVGAAMHPDAMLCARRGFVNAVLAIPDAATETYRSLETPIPATYVETRDDRVLRFERLRAAMVDLVGYGAFLASALAAALVAA